MNAEPRAPTLVIVDDDDGHAILVEDNLKEAGLGNPIVRFKDGQAALDYFFPKGPGVHAEPSGTYLLLLDIRLPKIDGFEVLRRLKADAHLHKIPVIMLTTTDDMREVARCHELGCNVYLQKPVDYERFAEAIRRLGLFVNLLLVPPLNAN